MELLVCVRGMHGGDRREKKDCLVRVQELTWSEMSVLGHLLAWARTCSFPFLASIALPLW